jgi:hypothetical protein
MGEELSLLDLNDSCSGFSAVVERQSEYLRYSSEWTTEGETVRSLLIQVSNMSTKKKN